MNAQLTLRVDETELKRCRLSLIVRTAQRIAISLRWQILLVRFGYSAMPATPTLSPPSFAWQAPCVATAALLALFGIEGCHRANVHDERPPAAAMPIALATAALTDQDGRALKIADFRDKTLVLNFIFTSCPSVCPRETQALSEVQRRLPAALGARVRFVSVTVDPDRDTPRALKEFALARSADLNGWSFVRANSLETSALVKELGVFAAPQPQAAAPAAPAAPQHTTSVYLFDGSGRLMQRYAGSPLDVTRLAREIEQLDGWFRNQEREPSAARL
jgi:protein SCO1/2